jgi:hypothetical protein
MTYEQIVSFASTFHNGKIPAMQARLQRTEGSISKIVGSFSATFQTLIRTNTDPYRWITQLVVISDETPIDVESAHLAVYEEWKACAPGSGGEVVAKYAPHFEAIQN